MYTGVKGVNSKAFQQFCKSYEVIKNLSCTCAVDLSMRKPVCHILGSSPNGSHVFAYFTLLLSRPPLAPFWHIGPVSLRLDQIWNMYAESRNFERYQISGNSLYLTRLAYSEYPSNSLWSVLSSNEVRIIIRIEYIPEGNNVKTDPIIRGIDKVNRIPAR